MSRRVIVTSAFLLLAGCARQRPSTVPDHPIEDRAVHLEGADLENAESAMATLSARSRAELPTIQERFVKGLRAGETLFLTVRLFHPDRSFEQAFVEVKEWSQDGIVGLIASDLTSFEEPARGDVLKIPESMVVDWTIVGPDGAEEGNRVGHYLESRSEKP